MNKISGKLLISVVIIILLLAAFAGGYFLATKEQTRWQNNFGAMLMADRDSIVTMVRNEQKLYQTQTITLTKQEFKQYFEKEFNQIRKEFKLKDPQQYTAVNTVTTNHINTVLRDSTINDTTHVKTIDYTAPNKNFWIKGYFEADSAHLIWKHYLNLQLVISKKEREGLANKVFIRPWKRPLVTTAIPSDSSTVITKLETKIIK